MKKLLTKQKVNFEKMSQKMNFEKSVREKNEPETPFSYYLLLISPMGHSQLIVTNKRTVYTPLD